MKISPKYIKNMYNENIFFKTLKLLVYILFIKYLYLLKQTAYMKNIWAFFFFVKATNNTILYMHIQKKNPIKYIILYIIAYKYRN